MEGLYWKTLLKWMIWGYPYSRKHPYIYILYIRIHLQIQRLYIHVCNSIYVYSMV